MSTGTEAGGGSQAGTAEVELAVRLCASWPELAPDELAAMFTDDAVYRNMPWPGEVVGGKAVAERLRLPDAWTAVDCQVLAVSSPGEAVFVERLEVFHLRSGEQVELPVVGVFEFTGGRIGAWRDYFDPTPFQKLLAAAAPS